MVTVKLTKYDCGIHINGFKFVLLKHIFNITGQRHSLMFVTISIDNFATDFYINSQFSHFAKEIQCHQTRNNSLYIAILFETLVFCLRKYDIAWPIPLLNASVLCLRVLAHFPISSLIYKYLYAYIFSITSKWKL